MGEELVAIATQVDAVLGVGRDASDDDRARAFRARLAAAQVVATAHAAAPGLTATRTVLYHAGALFRNLSDVDAVILFATDRRRCQANGRLRGRARHALGAVGRVSSCVS